MSRYTARRTTQDGVPVAVLSDAERDLTAKIAPAHGNIVFELLHDGKNWVYSPYDGPAQMQGKTELFGMPLLAPWANRLSADTYTVRGAAYTLNRKLDNLRLDHNNLPIHGLVIFASWEGEAYADEHGAAAHSTLQFTKRPEWMAQFPFAHRIEWRHRLADGRLSIRLTITNESDERIPLAIGFHPYFQIPRSERDDWKIEAPARTHMLLSDLNIPTGETEPTGFDGLMPLKGMALDDVYTDLVRNSAGDAVFHVTDGQHSIKVGMGPEFPVAVIYAPSHRNFICFEPMTAPTDAFHLAAEGRYAGLKEIAPDTAWSGEFWVEVS